MDSLSPQIVLPFLTAFVIIAWKKYYKTSWERIRCPLLVILSAASIGLASIMLFAAYIMLQNTFFSAGEKVLYCVVIAGLIGFIAWINLTNWKEWKRETKHKK